MARPSFSVNTRSYTTKTIKRPGAADAMTANNSFSRFSLETVRGGSGKTLPNGFREPSDYFCRVRSYNRSVGFYELEDRNADGSLRSRTLINGVIGETTLGPRLDENVFNDLLVESWVDNPPSSLRDKALVKARVAMKQGDVNLGVAFAERNMTARLLGDTASNIGNAYRSLRRGRWKDTCRHLGIPLQSPVKGNIPQQWLGYQYGWKPLLADVYGSVEALSRLPPSDWAVTGKGSAFDTTSHSIYQKDYGYSRVDGKVTGRRGVFVRIDAVPSNDVLKAFTSLGLTNPLLIAWELVPFSFVVDWALPIGSYLESLDAMLGYDKTYCSISYLRKANWSVQGSGGVYSLSGRTLTARESTQPALKRMSVLNREALKTVPLPTLPRFKDPWSLGRMANGLSLLAAAFSGSRR